MSDEPFLPYGKQTVDDEDVAAVARALRSDWLTTGPAVAEFENAVAAAAGTKHAVAVNSGTAALHAAYAAAGVGPGDEVIVPPLTFSATANAAVYLGATVRFADIDHTLTLSPAAVQAQVTDRTRVIAAVDYAGHSADYQALREIADGCGAALVADGCHALGGRYHDAPVGSCADMTCFSFHPVKHVTTGEGGAITTDDDALAQSMRTFRTHGIVRGVSEVAGEPVGGWGYDIANLGYNFRIPDVLCALGTSQIRHLDEWVRRRRAIADRYRQLLADEPRVTLPPQANWALHAYHLFPIRVSPEERHRVFEALRERRVGVQVHYIPVNALTYYRSQGYDPADTPVALEAYRGLISMPMFPLMSDDDVDRAVNTLRDVL